MSRGSYTAGGDSEAIKIRLIWGVGGLDKGGTNAWDSKDVGKVEWDETFDLSPAKNQEKMLSICEELLADTELV